MLIELRVQNYAVIDRLALRLEPGLNVLTGETGAGKSILVGALSLLLGERASSDAVREGAERAVVEGVFDVADRAGIAALLEAQGLAAEDGLLILRREVAAEGRNRVWINGGAATAGALAELGGLLVDLHGQHEHQALLRADEQRAILDAYGGSAQLAAEVAAAHTRVRGASTRRAELERRRAEVQQRADQLRHQAEEIERAGLRAGEEAELEAESTRLEHVEELARLSGQLHRELYEAEDAVAARLDHLRRALDHLIRIDPPLGEWRDVLDGAFYGLEELGRRMGEYRSRLEHDPGRLEEIRGRQDLLFRLKAKYGPELEDVAEAGSRAREELDAIDRAVMDRNALAREEQAARADLAALSARLSERRRAAAARLESAIGRILPDLGMDGGRLSIALSPCEPGSAGAETIEFRIALNAGFEPKPLARSASGGELSRVMLALKTVLAREDHVPTLVFDEIDVGIGGRVAHRVGEKLKDVAAHHQVFVVTHLAQIASRADHHLLVSKTSAEGRAATEVAELTGEARVQELARLLGGDPESAASIEHAREMLTAI